MSPAQQCQIRHGASSCLQRYAYKPLERMNSPLNGGGAPLEEKQAFHGQMARHEASGKFHVDTMLQRPSGQLQGRANSNENTNMPVFATTLTPTETAADPTTRGVDSTDQASPQQHGGSSNIDVNGDCSREVLQNKDIAIKKQEIKNLTRNMGRLTLVQQSRTKQQPTFVEDRYALL